MTRRQISIIFLLCAALVLAYLLFWPVPIDPEAWTPPKAPKLEGIYAPNDRLASIELLGKGAGIGPEDVSLDAQGRIYGGMVDGKIMRLSPGNDAELFADTGGRPAGLGFDSDGNLIVADGYKGLLSITPTGEISVLSNEAEGLPFGLTDDLDIASDGTIYFTDASYKFGMEDYMMDLMEHRPNGRFLSYDPDTGSTEVLLDGLYFANGVAVSPDQSFVLVAETGRYRVLRYWLAGSKEGEFEVFVDNLPGFPDGVSTGKEAFWLALVSPRDPATDFAFSHPTFRKVLVRLPSRILTPPRYGFVLGLDRDGRVVFNLQDPSGSYAHITSVQEEDGMLYLGSFSEDSIGRIPVPQRR